MMFANTNYGVIIIMDKLSSKLNKQGSKWMERNQGLDGEKNYWANGLEGPDGVEAL